jgi:hypothetical protein
MEQRILRSDDGVRRVRAMWLGSGAMRWPVDWTYVEWGIAFVCAVAVMPPVGLLATAVLGPLAGVVWALGLGGWLAYQLFDRVRTEVDADRPVRWWWAVVRHELTAGRRATGGPRSMALAATWSSPLDAARRSELVATAGRPGRSDTLRVWRAWTARRELARGARHRLGSR